MVLKVYRFHMHAFLLTYGMELTDFSINAIVTLAKQKTNKMVFSTEDLVLIEVLRQEKGYDNG